MLAECEVPSGEMIDFLNDLAILMEKYGIEITASNEWLGYAECGEDIQMRIETDGSKSYFSIPFGELISPNSIKRVLGKEEQLC